MTDIRLNISGSYEDQGWKVSYASIYPDGVKDDWTSKFGDARSEMNALGDGEAYRLIDGPQGVYYSFLRQNPVCSRGGIIQITFFAPKGKQPTAVLEMMSCMKQVSHFFDTDKEIVKRFFEDDVEAKAAFVKYAKEQMKDLASKEEPSIVGRKTFETQSSKTVYRVYEDEKGVRDLFENPHQDTVAQYKSLYMVKKGTKVTDNAILLSEPLQKLYTVVNGKDKYYVMDGNEVEVTLNSNPQMEPKTCKVIANGKSGDYYSVDGNTINVDEGKIRFTRKMTVRFSFPFDGKPLKASGKNDNKSNKCKKDSNQKASAAADKLVVPTLDELPRVSVDGPKVDLDAQWQGDVLVVSLVAEKTNTTVTVDSDDVKGDVSIDPAKEDLVEGTLEWKRRAVRMSFVCNGKKAKFDTQDTVSIVEEGGQTIKATEMEEGIYFAHIPVGKNYKVKLKSNKYVLANENTKVSSQNAPEMEIGLKYTTSKIVLSIPARGVEPLYFEVETDAVCRDDKSYGGFPVKKIGDGLSMKAVQPFWKLVAFIAGPLAVVFLVLMFLFLFKANTQQKVPQEPSMMVAKSAVADLPAPDNVAVVSTE